MVEEEYFRVQSEFENSLEQTYDIPMTTIRKILEAYGEGCQYVQEDEDSDEWSCSKCDNIWILNSDNPFENEMFYCPKCGRPITSLSIDEWDWNIEDENKHIEKIITRQEYDATLAK